MRVEVIGTRSRAAAASGLGTARDQAGRRRVPPSAVEISVLPRDHMCRASGWRAVWTAFVGRLMACFRQSQRRTTLFLEAILGQPCSAGLTVNLLNRVTDALRPAYDELCEQLPAQQVLNTDERGDEQVVAVDVRRPTLHGLSRAADARRHRAGRTAGRPVLGSGRLRPSQDVLVPEAVAMVLDASRSCPVFPRDNTAEPDRHRTIRRETTRTRPAGTGRSCYSNSGLGLAINASPTPI